MTLEEFVDQMQENIRDFAVMWGTRHTLDPEQYPLELPNERYWDEQFIAFMEYEE